jgi:hypothetical protein
VEAAFVCWYNNGQRRTLGQLAQRLEVSLSTVQRTAHDYDWVGRADHLDREARAIVDEQLIYHALSFAIGRNRKQRFAGSLPGRWLRMLGSFASDGVGGRSTVGRAGAPRAAVHWQWPARTGGAGADAAGFNARARHFDRVAPGNRAALGLLRRLVRHVRPSVVPSM